MRTLQRWLLTAVATGVIATGCAVPGSEGTTTTTTAPDTTTTTISNLGGDGLPVQQEGEEYGHFPSPISGALELEDNGCWKISLGGESRLVAFPVGYDKGSDGVSMVSPTEQVFTDGQTVDALGGLAAVTGIPGVPDGYWGGYITFCDPEATEIVVLDELATAYDPTILAPADLVEQVRSADLTESWGCGLGFTVSTVDQRVAIYLTPTDPDAMPVSPADLSGEAWIGTVVVGKNLMVNHCDDVAEFWEPERVVAAEWPVTSGALTFDPSGEDLAPCGGSGPVHATVEGLEVETPEGVVELGELRIANDSYGCFAG